MFSLICVWINGWVNNREAGDLRRRRGHCDVNIMAKTTTTFQSFAYFLWNTAETYHVSHMKQTWGRLHWNGTICEYICINFIYLDCSCINSFDESAHLEIAGLHLTNIKSLIPTWISNYIPSKMWDEITYPFKNFNACAIEVWEWIGNFIPHFIMDVITFAFCNQS